MRAQTEKTTFTYKDDFLLTKRTRRWTYSALLYFFLTFPFFGSKIQHFSTFGSNQEDHGSIPLKGYAGFEGGKQAWTCCSPGVVVVWWMMENSRQFPFKSESYKQQRKRCLSQFCVVSNYTQQVIKPGLFISNNLVSGYTKIVC